MAGSGLRGSKPLKNLVGFRLSLCNATVARFVADSGGTPAAESVGFSGCNSLKQGSTL